MTLESLLAELAGTGPLAGVLLYALYYQTQKVAKLEAKVEALYERVMQVMASVKKAGDSHDGSAA